ncbi:MAG: hypothetical protein V1682_05730 [Candidatus Omnitrophota bacterium]
MSILNMIRKNYFPEYRMLMAAIAVSLACHVFWLSAVKIVSGQPPKSSIRFSKVAFLGPILSGIDMEVRVTPASREMLEIRYRKMAGRTFYEEDMPAKTHALSYEGPVVFSRTDRTLASVIGYAAAGKKLEPDFPAE